MFRLIRWFCFPIARQIGIWPIGVYLVLTLILIGMRTWLRGGWESVFVLPESVAVYVTAYMGAGFVPLIMPTVYGLALVVFPLYAYVFDRKWYRRASAQDDG